MIDISHSGYESRISAEYKNFRYEYYMYWYSQVATWKCHEGHMSDPVYRASSWATRHFTVLF